MRTETKQDYIEFVTARLPTLRRLGYQLCGDENHADDLVQQMLTKLYVRWRRLHDVERLDPYVRTMLVRTFLDGRRRPLSRVVLRDRVPDR